MADSASPPPIVGQTQFVPGQTQFVPASDGYPLAYARYRAVGPVRAAVLCIHGIQSHYGWYEASCQAIAAAGFEVFFVDRRGSGHNQQDRGHCTGYKQLAGDLEQCIAFVRRECPGVPLVLLAISWGGKLALAALKHNPTLIDGLVLLCPGWFAKVSPTLAQKLQIVIGFLLRSLRLLPIPLSDPALFTATPSWQEFLRSDPLSLRRGTAQLLMTSRILDGVIADAPPAIRVPSLLVLAGRDRIIDNARTARFFGQFAAADKTQKLYPEAHHTLEFEPDPQPIFADLIAWLTERYVQN